MGEGDTIGFSVVVALKTRTIRENRRKCSALEYFQRQKNTVFFLTIIKTPSTCSPNHTSVQDICAVVVDIPNIPASEDDHAVPFPRNGRVPSSVGWNVPRALPLAPPARLYRARNNKNKIKKLTQQDKQNKNKLKANKKSNPLQWHCA
jgi:hypothetical protein